MSIYTRFVNKKFTANVELGIAFEKLRSEIKTDMEALLTKFRSDMYTRFDQIVGDNAQIREEQLFINHDIKGLKETDMDLDKRIKKLETRINM